jgi:hypothetical protein
MNLENLFKIKNYAEYMSCSPAWVLKLMKAGKLEYVRIDGVYFVVLRGEELEKYKEFRKELNALLNKSSDNQCKGYFPDTSV